MTFLITLLIVWAVIALGYKLLMGIAAANADGPDPYPTPLWKFLLYTLGTACGVSLCILGFASLLHWV